MQLPVLFISYAHVDKYNLVVPLVQTLREGGYNPWFDHNLIPGQDWKPQLLQAIGHCDTFVYAMTPESVASEWCLWELKQAAEIGKPIIPVLLQENTELPEELNAIQFVDFTKGPTISAVAKLMHGLRQAKPIPPNRLPGVPDSPTGTPAQAQLDAQVSAHTEDTYTHYLAGLFGFTLHDLSLNRRGELSTKQKELVRKAAKGKIWEISCSAIFIVGGIFAAGWVFFWFFTRLDIDILAEFDISPMSMIALVAVATFIFLLGVLVISSYLIMSNRSKASHPEVKSIIGELTISGHGLSIEKHSMRIPDHLNVSQHGVFKELAGKKFQAYVTPNIGVRPGDYILLSIVLHD